MDEVYSAYPLEDLLEPWRRIDIVGTLAIGIRVLRWAEVITFRLLMAVLQTTNDGSLTSSVQDNRRHLRRRLMKLEVVVFESTVVAPIAEEEGLDLGVKVRGVRSMERDGSSEAIGVLQRVVTVIPGSTVLGDSELVGKAVSRSDGALSDSIDTIVLEGVEHADAMPMQSSTIVLEMVLDGDFECVTPAGFDLGAWVLPIDDFAAIWPVHAIGVDVLVGDVQMVL